MENKNIPFEMIGETNSTDLLSIKGLKNKKVSVIMPSYNYDKYITEAIDSVLRQTYKNWELIIVEDGSTDRSLEIIEGYAARYADKISFYTHPGNENKGLKEAYQLGLKKVTGEYVSFLESDDTLHPESLKKRIEVFQQYPDVGFVYSDVELSGPESYWLNRNKKWIAEYRRRSRSCMEDSSFSSELLRGNFICTFSCVMIKKNILLQDDLNVPQEYLRWLDLWLYEALSQRTKFYYLSENLTYWTIHPKSQNSTNTDKEQKRVSLKYKRYLTFLKKRAYKRKKVTKAFLIYRDIVKWFSKVVDSIINMGEKQ